MAKTHTRSKKSSRKVTAWWADGGTAGARPESGREPGLAPPLSRLD